ncbi:hypothetical protein V2A60_003758 [Cordyceps javanica]
MRIREHIRVQTISFAPGVLPLSACTFRIVSCLRIATGRGIPLCFFSRVTAAFYNDRGQPVWSRRVLLYKIVPRNRTSFATGQEIVHFPREERRESIPQLQQDRTRADETASAASVGYFGMGTSTIHKTDISSTPYTINSIVRLLHSITCSISLQQTTSTIRNHSIKTTPTIKSFRSITRAYNIDPI